MREQNPIVSFLRELLESGKMTKEKMCVIAEVKYLTFENIFYRPTVSPMIRKSLQYSGIVPKNVLAQYDLWLSERKKKRAPAKKNNAS